MIPVGSAVPEGVGVGMDKGKRFALDAEKCSWNCQKQMNHMPSVFDFDSKLHIIVSRIIPWVTSMGIRNHTHLITTHLQQKLCSRMIR